MQIGCVSQQTLNDLLQLPNTITPSNSIKVTYDIIKLKIKGNSRLITLDIIFRSQVIALCNTMFKFQKVYTVLILHLYDLYGTRANCEYDVIHY